MQSKNMSNLDRVVLQKFEQWIKWKPKEELSMLTPITFANDIEITIEESKKFFRQLFENNFAKPTPRIKCDNCGDVVTFTGADNEIYFCEMCDNEIKLDYQDIEEVVYFVDKDLFTDSVSLTQVEILKRFRTEKKPNIKVENSVVPRNDTDIEVKPMKIAIITALEKELNPLLSLINSITSKGNGVYTYHEGFFGDVANKVSVVAAHCHRMGMVAATSLTVDIIHKYEPEYVAMVGMAASLERNNHGYGDVLIPSSILDYGSGKIVEDNEKSKSSLFEPYMLDLDAGLKNKLTNFKRDQDIHRGIRDSFARVATPPRTELKVNIGVMASGSAVVASKGFSEEMITQQHRKIIGIDMEIYGVFYACRYNDTACKPKCFAMKSVVDYADNEKSDKFHDYACFVSANALKEFALKYLNE